MAPANQLVLQLKCQRRSVPPAGSPLTRKTCRSGCRCSGARFPASQSLGSEALRPAWPSWIAGTEPLAVRKEAIRASRSLFSSFHSPRQRLVILENSSVRGLNADDLGAADGARRQMGEMPVIGRSVACPVLAHRREHDVDLYLHRAESDRPERIGIAAQDAAFVLTVRTLLRLRLEECLERRRLARPGDAFHRQRDGQGAPVLAGRAHELQADGQGAGIALDRQGDSA